MAQNDPQAAPELISAEALARRLRMLRATYKLKLRDLERLTGIAQSTLSRWEHATDAYPPVDELDKLGKVAYEQTVFQLLNENGGPRVYFHPKRLLHLSAVPAGSVLDQEGNIVAPLPGLG